jgi:hypothetical protein
MVPLGSGASRLTSLIEANCGVQHMSPKSHRRVVRGSVDKHRGVLNNSKSILVVKFFKGAKTLTQKRNNRAPITQDHKTSR